MGDKIGRYFKILKKRHAVAHSALAAYFVLLVSSTALAQGSAPAAAGAIPAPPQQQAQPPALTPEQKAAADAAARRKALYALSQEFVRTIGGRLEEADLYLSGAGKLELAQHKSKTQLPDDEPLIMHAVAGGNKVFFNQDIYTIKRARKLFVSLGDFATATDLAISVNPDKGTADGWFIRQDQTFHLDAQKNEVTIMGKKTVFDAADIDSSDPGNLLVSTALLEKWFDISFDYDFAALNLLLTTAQPLPAELAYLRRQKGSASSWGEEAAKRPRQEVPYALVSAPYIDVTTTNTITKTSGDQATSINNWNAITNSDLAGFNLEAFVSGNLPSITGDTNPKENPYFTNLRATLGKSDPEGNLLGPLRATSYMVGDISTVNPPLIGNSSQEQGFFVSNAPSDIVTQTSTDLRGNAQPGWDVELYRNDVYLAVQKVDVTGFYEFEDVQLVLGDNDLKLVFYGPHGEVSEQRRNILVDPSLLSQRIGYYSFSASRNNINTFYLHEGDRPPTAPGDGDLNLAMTYQYGLGRFGTLDLGVRRHSDGDGVQRIFSQGGLATFVGKTYINANVGVDNETLASAQSLTLRRNFGMQSGVMSYIHNSRGFNPSSPDGEANVKDTANISMSGPLSLAGKDSFFSRMNYSAAVNHARNYDGSSSTSLSPTLSARFQNFSLSGSIAHNQNTSADGDVTTTETASLVSNGFMFGGNWRLTTNYNVRPIFEATGTELSYDRPLAERLDSTTNLKYENASGLKTASTSLNWRTSKATISPTVSFDSENNFSGTINMHFGLAADPYTHAYGMYNSYLSGVGGVAARVFYDKEGRGIYRPGDELLSDVVIKASQVHRSAMTDTRGIAFIPDISNSTVTDIIADPSTFKDTYDMSLFEGVSIRTHPGSVTQLDFPVVTGGELDGQADFVDEEGKHTSAGNLRISLVAPDGKVEKTISAAFDGYYAISSIRPGVYYLTAKTLDAEAENGFFIPRLVVFKPDGTTLFGQGISLMPGRNTQFIYTSENAAPNGPRGTRVIKPEDIASQKVLIRLGQYHSRLALTFSWYRFNLRSPWSGNFSLVKPLLDIAPDPKTQAMELDLRPNKPMTMEEAARFCQTVQEKKFDCAVKVITKYRDLTVAAGL